MTPFILYSGKSKIKGTENRSVTAKFTGDLGGGVLKQLLYTLIVVVAVTNYAHLSKYIDLHLRDIIFLFVLFCY